ncbi:hypothetical protein CRG98_014260 [Punica granatum]|uniref:Uncharacterized protein n=1 Tax=Punica granatum TaxID=22663 RepID=A0A2I0K9W7_PUNGR|nr:hypothetical protein CRG98_014260 [Punica granatum]
MHVRGARRTGVRLECTGGAREASGARAGVRVARGWRAGRTKVRAGASGWRASVRLRVYCSPDSTSFTRNHLNDLK